MRRIDIVPVFALGVVAAVLLATVVGALSPGVGWFTVLVVCAAAGAGIAWTSNMSLRTSLGARLGPLLALAVVVMLGASLVAALLAARRFDDPPSRAHVSENLVLGGELLAYEVWDGVPYVVFRSADGRTVIFDDLRLDWISIELPPTPAWQLSGGWHTFRAPGDPASVGVVQGDETEIFGTIRSEDIERMEVEYEGRWHSFDVEAPGFLARLPGFDGIPSGYRWLDADGNVVWSAARVAPLRE